MCVLGPILTVIENGYFMVLGALPVIAVRFGSVPMQTMVESLNGYLGLSRISPVSTYLLSCSALLVNSAV